MWKRVTLSLTACGLAALAGFAVKSVSADPPAEKVAPPALVAKAETPAPVPTNGVKTAVNRVVAVTVYPNSALVTREVDVPEGTGISELIVTPLPPHTVNSSLYTEGTDGVRVLATRFRSRQMFEDTREDVRKLQDELEQLQMTREKIESDMKGVQENLLLLKKMENYTSATTASSAEKGALNSESAITLSKYIMEARMEKSKEVVNYQQQLQMNQKRTEFARRKLTELASGSSRVEQDAVIVVDKVNGPAGKVRLNYLVDAASWRPQYKLRAGKDAKDQIQLEYLAAVSQHTGEDWTGVKLVLSTAQPTLNSAPPDLQVLQVTVVPKGTAVTSPGLDSQDHARTLRSQAQKDFNEKKASSGAGLYNSAAALDQSFELLNPDAALKRGCVFAFREGPSVTYHLKTQMTVPSRNDEQIIEVTRIEMQPDYYFKAVPILTPHVYRLADLTNKSNYVLLPGEATMYLGTDFVGQMNMPLVAIGEQFTAGFGVDPQLQVTRQMTDKSRTVQGGNQILRYEFRILVSSYKTEKVKMQVWDRLPFADTDAVGVSLVKATPEVCKDGLYQREQRTNNLLRWDVNVDPTMSGEKAYAINYEFRLELDRQMSIGSFQSGSTNAAPVKAPTPGPGPRQPMSMNPAEDAKIKANLAKLSPEDRVLAERQRFCAIDQDSALGSMGPIFKVVCKGTPVFLCCKGCEKEAKDNPDETLQLLAKMMNSKK